MKNELRKAILNLRNNLNSQERFFLSKRIWDHLFTLPEFIKAKNIFIYLNFRSEVETIPFIDELFSRGKQVFAPVTNPDNISLTIYPLTKDNSKLLKGPYGIPQPEITHAPFNPAQIDLAIIPGVVFDLNCQRIGYGGGYYDRFLLSNAHSAVALGLAFDMQIVRNFEAEEHDFPMDLVVTEKRIIRRSKISSGSSQ